MSEITGALIGIGLVLTAVFLPMAFFGGSTGVIYRQFSVTIVSAMVLSIMVALILTPALCATLLKPVEAGHRRKPARLLRLVQPHLRRHRAPATGGAGAGDRPPAAGADPLRGVVAADGACCSCACRPRFLPEEDQGSMIGALHPAGRRHPVAHAGGRQAGRALLRDLRTRRTSTRCSRSPASASPAPARTLGHGLRPPERLEGPARRARTAPRRSPSAATRAPVATGPRRPGVRPGAAGGAGARPVLRLRPRAGGPRRSRATTG